MTSVVTVEKQIQTFFTIRARQLAKETFAIQRERKFDGSTLLQTLVFGWQQHPHSSLDQLASQAGLLHIHLSDTATLKHFTPETATFLQVCLQELTQIVVQTDHPLTLPLLNRFPQIVYEDSSIISLPDDLACIWVGNGGRTHSSRAALKLHVCFDLKSGRLWGPAITDGKHSDRSSPFRDQFLPRGSLKCSDLGYFDLNLIRQRQKRGIYTLGRVFATVKLFDLQGHPLRIEDIAPQEVGQATEQEVLMGGRQHLKVRLFLVRVPLSVETKRRRDAEQEAQRRNMPVSEAMLVMTRWTALFTDAPVPLLSLPEALVLQRERWQLEIFYKVWKQENEIDEWVSDNPWRILCECYAKLIGVLLQHWMTVLFAWQNAQRSLVKCAQVMQDVGWTMMEALSGRRSLRSAFFTIRDRMQTGCEKSKRRGRPNAAQLLEEGLPWMLELLA
jgi:hypothetical protein